MSVTGRANRQTILRNTRGALGRMGLTTAIASATHFIRDATRYVEQDLIETSPCHLFQYSISKEVAENTHNCTTGQYNEQRHERS